MGGTRQKNKVSDLKFVLPVLHDPLLLRQGLIGNFEAVDITNLVGAIQHGATIDIVRKCLSRPADQEVRENINLLVCGVPAMFFVVSTCNRAMIRLWVKHGGDVNAVHQPSELPLLAFAILHQETVRRSTTQVVATLLSLGAMPRAVPPLFWEPYDQDLPLDPYQWRESELGEAREKWCTPPGRIKLAGFTNLTHRYNLCRASAIKPRLMRERQVAVLKKAERLFEIPYFLIGQAAAIELLTQKLLCHITFDEKLPLVLVFAGPSGHGKTELARSFGDVLSLDIEIVDCTGHRQDTDLFGAKPPFQGWKTGSPLNNFLARKGAAGQRGVVFLDEFEKMDHEIFNSLLDLFALGKYVDRRSSTTVECPGIIFVLAPNALDDTIAAFCLRHYKALFINEDKAEVLRLVEELRGQLKQVFLSRFGAPLTGRISTFIPFLHFSPSEQAVVAHKFLLELIEKVREPPDLKSGQVLGNVSLRVQDDASVCRAIAEAYYHPHLGARSLSNGVRTVVRNPLVREWMKLDTEVVENEEKTEYLVKMDGDRVVVNRVG